MLLIQYLIKINYTPGHIKDMYLGTQIFIKVYFSFLLF